MLYTNYDPLFRVPDMGPLGCTTYDFQLNDHEIVFAVITKAFNQLQNAYFKTAEARNNFIEEFPKMKKWEKTRLYVLAQKSQESPIASLPQDISNLIIEKLQTLDLDY